MKIWETPRYTVFRTKWGYFGLAGFEDTLWRTHLPATRLETVKSCLLSGVQTAKNDESFFKELQKQISAYFEGVLVEFNPGIAISLDRFRSFTMSVLTACRRIRFGQTISYSALAENLGRPSAARAVGNALAANPLPLIIPCHRVIRRDGKIGGFTAPGATNLKRKMLLLEQPH